LLIDATCVPADSRHPTDLSLLNRVAVFAEGVALEFTEALIDRMHPQVKESLGYEPPIDRKRARKQFLTMGKKKRPRIEMIRKAINHSLGHLKRNLDSIDALTACGLSLLAAGRYD
jgi:IS5 family transposase